MATTKANPSATRAARNAAKAAKKRVRKRVKKYTFATFETDIFEGEFKLPVMRQMPHNYAIALNAGNIEAIYLWLEEAGVPDEDIEAIKSLDSEEFEEFSQAWNNGELGK